MICEETLPKALGVIRKIVVEIEHQIGAPQPDRRDPKQVIKQLLLQKFRNKSELIVKGHDALLFSDYSAEVSRKRKMFSKICSQLHLRKILFTLVYSAILHLAAPNRKQHSFLDPEDAEAFLEGLQQNEKQSFPMPIMRTP